MKTFGNIIWLIFGGLISSIFSFLAGVVCCITIIFIPVGLQYFKVARFVLWPMGKKVVATNCNGFKTFLNVLWAILAGWEGFLVYALFGLILCITIIGIPFGRQFFKIAKFIFLPLGHDFVPEEDIPVEKAAA